MIFQTTAGILNSVISTVYFSDNFSSVLNKKKRVSCICMLRKETTDWILNIFSVNFKSSLYLLLILTFNIFDVQNRQGVT